MNDRPISDLIKGLALGALNGAIYAAVQFILVEGYYDYLIRLDAEKMEQAGLSPVQMTDMVNKRIVSVWFILVFAIASCAWHRYSRKIRRSPILFWEAIGISAIVGWNLLVLTLFWIESRFTGQNLSYQSAVSLSNPLFGPFSLGLAILTNFLYGVSLGILNRLSEAREQQM